MTLLYCLWTHSLSFSIILSKQTKKFRRWTAATVLFMCIRVVMSVLWDIQALAEPVKCVRNSGGRGNPEVHPGDKSSLPTTFWISCFLFMAAHWCCPVTIRRLSPLTPQEQKHILCWRLHSLLLSSTVTCSCTCIWKLCASHWMTETTK